MFTKIIKLSTFSVIASVLTIWSVFATPLDYSVKSFWSNWYWALWNWLATDFNPHSTPSDVYSSGSELDWNWIILSNVKSVFWENAMGWSSYFLMNDWKVKCSWNCYVWGLLQSIVNPKNVKNSNWTDLVNVKVVDAYWFTGDGWLFVFNDWTVKALGYIALTTVNWYSYWTNSYPEFIKWIDWNPVTWVVDVSLPSRDSAYLIMNDWTVEWIWNDKGAFLGVWTANKASWNSWEPLYNPAKVQICDWGWNPAWNLTGIREISWMFFLSADWLHIYKNEAELNNPWGSFKWCVVDVTSTIVATFNSSTINHISCNSTSCDALFTNWDFKRDIFTLDNTALSNVLQIPEDKSSLFWMYLMSDWTVKTTWWNGMWNLWNLSTDNLIFGWEYANVLNADGSVMHNIAWFWIWLNNGFVLVPSIVEPEIIATPTSSASWSWTTIIKEIKNKSFYINISDDLATNETYTNTNYKDITLDKSGSIFVIRDWISQWKPSVLNQSEIIDEWNNYSPNTTKQTELNNVISLILDNKEQISNTKWFLAFSNWKESILAMKDVTYNKYWFIISTLEKLFTNNTVNSNWYMYNKFIDINNNLVIYYKLSE